MATQDPRLKLPGVRRRGAGWQVYRQVRGVLETRSMPLESTVAELVAAWEGLAGPAVLAVVGSLAEAVTAYLPTVTAMPSYQQKEAHLKLMLQALGRDRLLTSVTPLEIGKLIQVWKKTPRVSKKGQGGRPTTSTTGLDDETIRKRLGNMQRFFTVMLPVGAVNAVAACKDRPSPKKAATRGVLMSDVERILDAMPDYTHGRGMPKHSLSLAKVRATVSAYTGLDPAQLSTLTPADLVLDGDKPSYRIGRSKGDKVAVQRVPLTEAGRAAFKMFVAANAFGTYRSNAVNQAVRVAAAKVGIPLGSFRAKDLRHSFLTEMYRLTRDQATVARFALHEEGSAHTARYTRAAHEAVDEAAAKAFPMPTSRKIGKVLQMASAKRDATAETA